MSEQENTHAAASPADCESMGKKYNWKLKRVVPNKTSKVLPVDCIFEGEQTSFEDKRYGD